MTNGETQELAQQCSAVTEIAHKLAAIDGPARVRVLTAACALVGIQFLDVNQRAADK